MASLIIGNRFSARSGRRNTHLSQENFWITIFCSFFFLAMSQNIISVILFWKSDDLSLLILIAKELIIIPATALYIIAYPKRLNLETMIVILLAGCYFIAAIRSPQGDVRQLRQCLNLHVLFLCGITMRNYLSAEKIKKIVLIFLAIVALSGYIEYFFLRNQTESFWSWMDFSDYYISREGSSINLVENGVPGGWKTYDYFNYFGPLKRMTSLFVLDPLLFAHAISLPLVYGIIKRNMIIVTLFGGAMIFSISKGGWLVVVLAVLFYSMSNMRSKFLSSSVTICLGFLIAAASLNVLGSASSVRHSEGLVGAFEQLPRHPFGTGIGTGGNLALREARIEFGKSNADFGEYGAESYIGGQIVQVGILGLISYLFFGFLIWWRRPRADDDWSVAIRFTALATWVAGLGAETPISMVGTGYLFILVCLIPTAKSRAGSVSLVRPKRRWRLVGRQASNTGATRPERRAPAPQSRMIHHPASK